jgi:hypothetical protein
MKLNKIMPPAAMLVVILMGPFTGSQARTLTTQHGSVCKPFMYDIPGVLYSSGAGVWNISSAMLTVLCPITRVGEVSFSGLRVWIGGYAPSGSTVACGLASFDNMSNYIAGEQLIFKGTGTNFDYAMVLRQAEVPMYSYQSVLCDMPAGSGINYIQPDII